MALASAIPIYKGRKRGEIVLCQYPKNFFKIRQKSTNGLMAFGDNNLLDDSLAPDLCHGDGAFWCASHSDRESPFF